LTQLATCTDTHLDTIHERIVRKRLAGCSVQQQINSVIVDHRAVSALGNSGSC